MAIMMTLYVVAYKDKGLGCYRILTDSEARAIHIFEKYDSPMVPLELIKIEVPVKEQMITVLRS